MSMATIGSIVGLVSLYKIKKTDTFSICAEPTTISTTPVDNTSDIHSKTIVPFSISAFSLTELSIAILLVTVLVSFVVAGSRIIESATIQNAVRATNEARTMQHSFYEMEGRMAGDLNGDGYIDTNTNFGVGNENRDYNIMRSNFPQEYKDVDPTQMGVVELFMRGYSKFKPEIFKPNDISGATANLDKVREFYDRGYPKLSKNMYYYYTGDAEIQFGATESGNIKCDFIERFFNKMGYSITDPLNKREAIADGCVPKNNVVEEDSVWFCEHTKRATGLIKIGDLATSRYIDESNAKCGIPKCLADQVYNTQIGRCMCPSIGQEIIGNACACPAGHTVVLGTCHKQCPVWSKEGYNAVGATNYNVTVNLVCNAAKGYTVKAGDPKITCGVDGKWVESGVNNNNRCYKQCPKLSGEDYKKSGLNISDANAYKDAPATNHNTNVTLECANNYIINGSGRPTIRCNNGVWEWGSSAARCHLSGSVTFNHKASAQVFRPSFPVGTKLKFAVYGAQGGGNRGGKGGVSRGIYELKNMNSLYVYVGSAGGDCSGGWNGGGSHCGKSSRGRYGGGASDIRISETATLTCDKSDPRLIVAGGGGGSYDFDNIISTGGAGGGTNMNGGNGSGNVSCAGGGTLTSTGTTGTAPWNGGGTQGTGGCGVGGIGGWFGAGTSGGGWYGGGGAAETGAGGGGSGYCDQSKLDCRTGASGQRSGNGMVVICWGSNNDCGF